MMSSGKDWEKKYYRPVIEERTVGFSGMDPQRKYSEEEEKAIIETVEEVIEEKVDGMVEERINMIVDIQVGE